MVLKRDNNGDITTGLSTNGMGNGLSNGVGAAETVTDATGAAAAAAAAAAVASAAADHELSGVTTPPPAVAPTTPTTDSTTGSAVGTPTSSAASTTTGASTSTAAAAATIVQAVAAAGAIAAAGAVPNATPSVSAVWAYFDKDTMGNSICKFCDRVIKGHHSSNLLSHLRTAGRTDSAHQQASAICEEHRENKRHVKRQKMALPTAAEFAATYPHLVAAAAAAAAAAPFGFKAKDTLMLPTPASALAAAATAATVTKDQREQMGLVPPATLGCTPEQLAQDVALLVLVDNLPFNFTALPGFQNLAQVLMGDKKTHLPDEETVLKNIHMLHQSMILTIKMLLTRARGVGLTLETWAHPSPELAGTSKYLMINAHFSVNFRGYHVTINCTPVDDGLDLATLRTALDQTTERFNIKDKILVCIAGDLPWKEGAEVPLLASDLPTVYSPVHAEGRTGEPQLTSVVTSAASLLRRCLKKELFLESFPHIVISIDAFLRRLVSEPAARAVVKRKCPLVDPESFAKDEAIVSYYDFLCNLHDALPTLEQTATAHQVEYLPESSVEWITFVLKKMRPFARYADAFEGEKQKKSGSDKEIFKDGLSSVSTIVAALVPHIEKLAVRGDDGALPHDVAPEIWKAFFDATAKELRSSFGALSSVCLASTLLDPRYKDRDYCYLEPEVERADGENFLRRLFEIFGDDGAGVRSVGNEESNRVAYDAVSVNGDSLSKGESQVDARDGIDEDDDLLTHLPTTTAKDGSADSSELVATWAKELTAFLSLPLADRNVNPLQWWKMNQLRFPLMAPYAELLLSLPAAASAGKTTRRGIDSVLLRFEGCVQDESVSNAPGLMDAFMLFQRNREYAVEWFSSSSTVAADPSMLSQVEDHTNFKHIENV